MDKHPNYKKFLAARIIKLDHERTAIIDFMLANLYKVFLMLHDRNWQEAFITVYANLCVTEIFNEFIVCVRLTLLLALLLQKMEVEDKALKVLEYLRDLVEDTNNN